MAQIKLIIEKSNDKKLWGRVQYKDNLLVESSTSIILLEKKMKKLLKEFHQVDNINFDYYYDVSAFFENFDFLKQTKIAELSGINPGLLRQYASGVKQPSTAQAKKIEAAIHKLAQDLKEVSLYAA